MRRPNLDRLAAEEVEANKGQRTEPSQQVRRSTHREPPPLGKHIACQGSNSFTQMGDFTRTHDLHVSASAECVLINLCERPQGKIWTAKQTIRVWLTSCPS